MYPHDLKHTANTPDTGWPGHPEIPIVRGGDYEPDFMHKPPYWWTSEASEGSKFVPKYIS